MLKITFIGTSSAKVSLRRFFSSLLFETDEEKILIDCGEGISKALLQQKIDFNSITKILISHTHSDHLSGLAGLITQFKMLGRNSLLDIISHKLNMQFIKNFLFGTFLIPERINFNINFIDYEYNQKTDLYENFSFISKENSHLKKYLPYSSVYNLPMASPSFLFNYKDKNIFYSSDLGSIDDLFLFKEAIEVFICEITHIDISELTSALEKLRIKKVYLTHIPEEKESEILKKIQKRSGGNGNIILAYDGLSIPVE